MNEYERSELIKLASFLAGIFFVGIAAGMTIILIYYICKGA